MKRIVFAHPLKKQMFFGLRRNKLLFFLGLLLFAGIVFGAVSSRTADALLMKRLDFIFQTNFDLRTEQGWFAAFVSSFASSVIFLLLLLLLGLSLWGGVLTAAVPFFKGYGYGLSVGYLYAAYGLKGIFYNILVILPGMFLSALVLTASAVLSWKNAFRLCASFLRISAGSDGHGQLRDYRTAMLRCLVVCALAAVLDMLCALCFSWIFQF